MNNKLLEQTRALRCGVATLLVALCAHGAAAGDKPFPKLVPALTGSLPEGFAIGRGTTAFNGSVDGSIWKMNLRNGEGEVLVAADPAFVLENGDCFKLGMRVDPRTNYLFAAGCAGGNAYVFDADNGSLLMEFPLPLPQEIIDGGDTFQIINDLTVTPTAVFFTDAHQGLLYRLPLTPDGGLPAADAATPIVLNGDFNSAPAAGFCCNANGIVSTPDGSTVIIGHSNFGKIYRVDTDSGETSEIVVDGVFGFLDGFALRGRTLYIMTPGFGITPDDVDRVQVVTLNPQFSEGELTQVITDDDLDGPASGALFGNSLYVNNAQYNDLDPQSTEKSVTRLKLSGRK